MVTEGHFEHILFALSFFTNQYTSATAFKLAGTLSTDDIDEDTNIDRIHVEQILGHRVRRNQHEIAGMFHNIAQGL